MRRILRWILSFWPVQFFLIKILPKIRWTMSAPKMDGFQFKDVQDRLQVGDMLFSIDRSKLAGMLVPGRWDHAAIYMGDDLVFEAVQPAARMTTIFDFCHHADEVGIARFEWPDPWPVIRQVLHSAINKPYDSFFEQGLDAIYCSEICAGLDVTNKMGRDESDFLNLGWPYVAPDDLFEAKNVIRIKG